MSLSNSNGTCANNVGKEAMLSLIMSCVVLTVHIICTILRCQIGLQLHMISLGKLEQLGSVCVCVMVFFLL